MKQNILRSIKLLTKLNKRPFLTCILSRHSSSGVNLWTEDLTDSIKMKIEDYWKDKVNIRPLNDEHKDKFYVLAMFPYPSGALHLGHVRVYSISDSVARFQRLRGKHVIHPMGWDAFGLPAENAALEKKVDPSKWTHQNIKYMQEQLKSLGCSFDWDREFATCDPKYYKWTQQLFLYLYKKDLIYQKEEYVNWDPIDQTVLAEEQVDENNRSWRSGAKVEKKLLKQWFVRTTAYARDLLDGLKDSTLKEWKDIIQIQKNWIGECNGYSFEFNLSSDDLNLPKTINLWTSNPEFIEHAKYIVLSSKSILAKVAKTSHAVNEKTKVIDARAINPFTNAKLPIFINDEHKFPVGRDNYLGIPCAVMDDMQFIETVGIPFERHRIRTYEEQQKKMSEILTKAKERKIGGYPVSSRLKDWLISRQRYWGTPIPIIHCEKCGPKPVPQNQLPVTLPSIENTTSSRDVLINSKEWLSTFCPDCGSPATREVDTMDTFVDSSWYFMRFLDSKNNNEMFSVDKAKKYLPVDLYIGGKEHGALHLYYARFINHFLYNEGFVPTREPFKQLLVQGMVMGKTYKLKKTGQYLKPQEVDEKDGKAIYKETSEPVITNWEKMSKSKHNGVNPMELLSKYGIDTTRLLMLADVAPVSNRKWSNNVIPGVMNWQKRLWLTLQQFLNSRSILTRDEINEELLSKEIIEANQLFYQARNHFLKLATHHILGTQHWSVAISKMQGLTKNLRSVSPKCYTHSLEFERALVTQIIMLAPIAPHFASELWSGYCSAKYHLIDRNEVNLEKDVLEQKWPMIDLNYIMKINIFINNALKKSISISYEKLTQMDKDKAMEKVLADSDVIEILKDSRITNIKFLLEENCDLDLFINVKKFNATQNVSVFV